MDKNNIPNHIAIIMDGNGRWAKKRKMPRTYGHLKGAQVVEKILKDADELGVKYLTVYAFSTENWSRPDDEIKTLMKILRNYLKDCIKKSKKNNVICKVIGDKSRLEEDIIKKIDILEQETKDNTGITFIIALNYGARDEIRRGIIKIANKLKLGELSPEDITEDLIAQNLDTYNIPNPDLLIRTSGEQRLSNFLLWQLGYSEFYFTDTLWPDFQRKDLILAIEDYQNRQRRFGKV